MKVQSELLKSYLAEALFQYLQEFPEDVVQETESLALRMLEEIKNILENTGLDDFEKVEEIGDVFQKCKVRISGCHDCF